MKLLNIKWEKILVLVYSLFYIIRTIIHINKYGFDFESDMDIFMIYLILITIIYFNTLWLRKKLIEEGGKK